MITDKAFWKGAGERLAKTFIQTFFAVLAVQSGVVYTLDAAVSLPWETALVTSAIAAFMSLGMSVGNADFTRGQPLPSEE